MTSLDFLDAIHIWCTIIIIQWIINFIHSNAWFVTLDINGFMGNINNQMEDIALKPEYDYIHQ